MPSRPVLTVVAALLAAAASFIPDGARAEDALTNPLAGDSHAIEEGRTLYRTICYICHLSQGGRGPNLFASSISDEQFLEVAINGRKGTTMPAFGLRLSPDEVWAIQAYVKSTDHYE
ncbi:MAG: cytochrome c [Parvibaculaceae bacterium]